MFGSVPSLARRIPILGLFKKTIAFIYRTPLIHLCIIAYYFSEIQSDRKSDLRNSMSLSMQISDTFVAEVSSAFDFDCFCNLFHIK